MFHLQVEEELIGESWVKQRLLSEKFEDILDWMLTQILEWRFPFLALMMPQLKVHSWKLEKKFKIVGINNQIVATIWMVTLILSFVTKLHLYFNKTLRHCFYTYCNLLNEQAQVKLQRFFHQQVYVKKMWLKVLTVKAGHSWPNIYLVIMRDWGFSYSRNNFFQDGLL